MRKIEWMGTSGITVPKHDRETIAAKLKAAPKLSKILRGRFAGISEAYITEGLRKLGHDVEIRVTPRHEGVGATHVVEAA